MAWLVLVLTACGQGVAIQPPADSAHVARTSATPFVADDGVIPWLPLPPPSIPQPKPLPSKPVTRTAAACSASQLKSTNLGSSGRTADRGAVISFRNISGRTCRLAGAPQTTMYGPGYGPVVVTGRNHVGTSYDMPPGQSTQLWFSATDACVAGPQTGTPIVNRLVIAIPGGGTVTVDRLAVPRACGIAEGNFDREPPPPTYPQQPLTGAAIRLVLPPSAHAGAVMTYLVLVRNPTRAAITITPCPVYSERLEAGSRHVPEYGLNCAGRASLAPGSTLRFQMKFTIPADAPTGQALFHWFLLDTMTFWLRSASVWVVGNDSPCQPRQLSAAATGPAVAFSGSGLYQGKDAGTSLTVQVTNTSSTLCTLQGAPTFDLRDSHGKSLGLRYNDKVGGQQPPTTRVTLPPGAEAQAALTWHTTWCAADPNPVSVTLGLPSGGAVSFRPGQGWTPPPCRGWDFPYAASSTPFA
jgi:Protein of unknown function (DUF4232)